MTAGRLTAGERPECGTIFTASFAGIILGMAVPESLIAPPLRDFSCKSPNIDALVSLCNGFDSPPTGDKIISEEGVLYLRQDGFRIVYSDTLAVDSIDYQNCENLSRCNQSCCNRRIGNQRICYQDSDEVQDRILVKFKDIGHPEAAGELMDTIKAPIFRLLQRRGLFVLHSASIIYNGKVIAFSAHSGVGKSTHTNMWTTLYDNEIFNGDCNVIGFKGEKPTAYAIPWCGTSGLYRREDMDLGAICLISRGETNTCSSLEAFDSVTGLLCHALCDNLTEEGITFNIKAAEAMEKAVPIFSLKCRPDEEAVAICREYVDNLLGEG